MSATPEQERGPTRTYVGEAIEVHWEPRRCIHVRNCVHDLPNVFLPDARPWVSVDAANADAVAAAVERCPTGALHYRRLDGGTDETPRGRDHDRAPSERPTLPPRQAAYRRRRRGVDPG